jgi:hypothetical protein
MQQRLVLFCRPGPLDEVGVEDLLPAMQTLHIRPVLEEGGYLLPVASAVGVHQFLESLVFLLRPPPKCGQIVTSSSSGEAGQVCRCYRFGQRYFLYFR